MKQLAQVQAIAEKREAEVASKTTGADQALIDALSKINTATAKEFLHILTSDPTKKYRTDEGLTVKNPDVITKVINTGVDLLDKSQNIVIAGREEGVKEKGSIVDASSTYNDGRRNSTYVTNVNSSPKNLFGEDSSRMRVV